MVVVLPEPLTPTIRMTNGFCAASITSGRATGPSTLRDLGGEHRRGLRRAVMSRSKRSRRSASVTVDGHVDAEIGLDQDVLELVQHRLRRAASW